MYVYKFFFETTLFNAYHSAQSMAKQQYTRQLFQGITKGRYAPYTSGAVIDELKDASKEHYQEMYNLIEQFGMDVLPVTEEVERIAKLYVSKDIIPAKYMDDALHIATATVHGLDFVASYNFEHIVKLKTINRTGLVNLQERYKIVGLITPEEVIEHERS
jgi:predicted nucleic acid-binding protein